MYRVLNQKNSTTKRGRSTLITSTMPSSKGDVNGPTPTPSSVLQVPRNSYKAKKSTASDQSSPVQVIHMLSPRIIHARPRDFMRVVQHLTGKHSVAAQPLEIRTAFEQNESAEARPTDY